MTQHKLNNLWRLNQFAVRLGFTLPLIACSADSFEQIITVRNRTWHRENGSLDWVPMKPLLGNLRT